VRTEPSGFREFVVARSPALLRTAWMLTGDQAAAEDLLQTALARTWPHWARIADGQPDAYVRKVMVRTNANWRARRWNQEIPTADSDLRSQRHQAPDGDDPARLDDRLILLKALAMLPVRQRQVVVLRYFDDLSAGAVADVMGCSTGTVKSQSAKGLAKLRQALEATEPDRTSTR
jgi:RNA polymerase sigma-70 factor (sigma-E family)